MDLEGVGPTVPSFSRMDPGDVGPTAAAIVQPAPIASLLPAVMGGNTLALCSGGCRGRIGGREGTENSVTLGSREDSRCDCDRPLRPSQLYFLVYFLFIVTASFQLMTPFSSTPFISLPQELRSLISFVARHHIRRLSHSVQLDWFHHVIAN
ncbi:hypothetical protein P691DRAFT_106515 [Macrolepiota fuliginosa MF-IS2]|uniref:Uncharacterized protein n=1 Tax=Macrolepiota fuliginosa MF-IS2 TaxID=1400762 RepID=A0A9P6BV94_9AGAR|nr:hypothetical protein P691DRAFT_106515 [Macrolepiota fuliginosa MF-IS2]